MSHAARSLVAFGTYMLLLGVVLLVAPNRLLPLLGQPETSEVWIRVVGMLVVLLGCYYVLAARSELKPFFYWTIPVRLSVLLFIGAFVALGYANAGLLIFGIVDVFAAGWTWLALRADKRNEL